MGMAASQARLCSLTSIVHDLSLKAQNIERQKLDLALLNDEAYKEYCDALDSTIIQVGRKNSATGTVTYVDACFDTVCGYQPLNCTQHSLVNSLNGRVIVSPEIKEIYANNQHDKYTFAWAAMGYDGQFGWDTSGPWGSCPTDGHEFIGIETNVNYGIDDAEFPLGLSPAAGFGKDLYMSEAEYLVFLQHYEAGGTDPLSAAYEDLLEASQNNAPTGERKQLLAEFRTQLYKYAQEILNAMNMPKDEAPGDVTQIPTNIPNQYKDNANWSGVRTEFNYYTKLWEQITEAGGCEEIDELYTGGEDGEEWFNAMVKSGRVQIYTIDIDKDQDWEATTMASFGNDLIEESDDALIKKAEVKYEETLRRTNKKDSELSAELKKLETRKTACETEMEALKKVTTDNIDKTFNLFG